MARTTGRPRGGNWTQRLLIGAVVAAIALVWASPAGAHVTVQPPEAQAGGFTKLTFRVPNERPDAATVSLRVSMPTDHPIANVSVKPKAGWQYELVETTLDTPIEVHGEPVSEVVSEVSWTGGQIQPGEFEEFELSVGPLPEGVDVLYFPTIQVYASGEQVDWIQVPQSPDEELERPAPKLTLETAGDDDATSDSASTGGSGAEVAAASSTSDDGGSDTLAIVALVIALAAVVLALAGIAMGRRSTSA